MKGVVGRERVEFRFYLFHFLILLSKNLFIEICMDIVCYTVLPVRRQETQAASPTDRLLPWVL